MYFLLHIFLFSSTLFLFFFFIKKKKLNIKKDFLFLIFTVLSFIYTFIFPIINVNFYSDSHKDQLMYFWIMLMIVLFFYLPFFIWYNPRILPAHFDQKKSIVYNHISLFLFSGFIISVVIYFHIISFRNNIYFARNAVYDPSIKADLSFIDFFVYNIFTKFGKFIFLFMFIIYRRCSKLPIYYRIISLVSLGSYSLFLLINSRLGAILFLLQIIGLFLMEKKRIQLSPKFYFYLILFLLLGIYSYNVVINIRSHYDDTGINLALFNPFNDSGDPSVVEPIQTRLDGIFLMSQMTPVALKTGFAYGKAWVIPLFLTIGPIFFREQSNAIKASYLTDAEGYLLTQYTDLANSTMDFNSIFLTDAYCNFFIVGFLLCAFVFSKLISISGYNVIAPKNSFHLIIGLYFYSQLFTIESEFISLLTNFIKILPIIILLIMLNPIKKIEYKII